MNNIDDIASIEICTDNTDMINDGLVHMQDDIDDDLEEDLKDNNIIIDNQDELQNANNLLDADIVKIYSLPFEKQILEIENNKKSEQYLSAPYKCDLCAKWWLHEYSFTTHLLRHSESSGKLMCEVCKQRYLTKKNYRNHVLTHELRFQCKICMRTFCSRAAINQHITQHNGISPKFICNICDKKSTSRGIHRKHLRTHNPEKKFQCPHCSCAFQHSASRNQHITRAHGEQKKLACDICHLTFTDEDSLKLHSQKHLIRKDFYCAECNIIFKSKVTLNEHLKFSGRHGDSKFLTYSCEICEKKYANAIKLRRHVESSHLGQKNYKCKSCSATFQTPGGLRSHIVFQHEGRMRPKNKICAICGKAFASKIVLQNHVMTHTGERPHSCHICSNSFRQKSSLIKHIDAIHRKIKREVKKKVKVEISVEEG